MLKENKNIFQVLLFFLAACAFFLPFLPSGIPFLKYISVIVRYNNTRFLPILIALLFLALSVKQQRLSVILTALVVFPICALALIGLWSSMYTETNVITGILPRMDALSYYTSAMALLEKGAMVGYTRRRPLFGALFAFLLSITNRNPQTAMIIFTFFCALVLFLTLLEVRRMLNPIAALVFFIPQFLYFRMYSGNIMSETLGFYLGMLSFLLFLRALAHDTPPKHSFILFTIAAFVFTLAQLARPGALLTIPFLVLFAGWYYAKKGKNAFHVIGFVIVSIFIAFLINRVMFNHLTAGISSQYNNMGYGIYGVVAGGKSWGQMMIDFPEIGSLPPGIRENKIFEIIVNELLQNPGNFFKGMWVQFGYIFSLFPIHGSNIYSYMLSSANTFDGILIGAFFVFSILGVIKIALTPDHPLSVLIIVFLIGFFLSLPISPAYQSRFMRYYPATIPLLGFLPAMGVAWLISSIKKSPPDDKQFQQERIPLSILSFGAMLSVVVILLGPFLLLMRPQNELTDVNCLPDESQVIIPFYENSAVAVQTISITWLPKISEEDFRQSVLNIPNVQTKNYFRSLPVPLNIFPSINLLTDGVLYVFPDKDHLPLESTLLKGCGRIENENGDPSTSGFFYPRFLEPIDHYD